VVCHPDRAAAFQAAERVRNEFVLRVTGTVRRRPEGMVNPELRSGEIEVLAHEVEISIPPRRCHSSSTTTSPENTRLTHRVVDLRREPMQRTCACATASRWRCAATSMPTAFIDIETPMLTRSTPEVRATISCRAACIPASSTRCRSRRSCSSSC